ncbi:unnamed protein product [Auanema sp. JU1783]|nr:unnamed protein product [Auanema sp. JU1783]
MGPQHPLFQILLSCLILFFTCQGSVLRTTKIGQIRRYNIDLILDCFKEHSEQNKRVYASTEGNIAKLYDENGVEIECKNKNDNSYPYDQHCFFSPLNCFFNKIRLNKQTKMQSDGPDR